MSAAWYGQNGRTSRGEPDEREAVSTERTDSELLLASREDPESFTELYRRHAEDILRYFARRTLDPEAAAELTAETFAQAFASRQTYTDTGVNGVAWLYGVARHQLGRFFRAGRVDAAARRVWGCPSARCRPRTTNGSRTSSTSPRSRTRSSRPWRRSRTISATR